MDLLNFWQSFFGINLNPMDRYIDDMRHIFPFQKSQIWGKKEAVWVDVHDAWKLYIEIPELRAVIDKRAQMMASNHACLYDASGTKVDKHWVLDLIDKPNAVQSWADVVYSLSVQDGLYNNAFAYAPARMAGIRNLIVPLPADKVKMHLSGKKLKQMDAQDLVDKFTFVYDTGDKEDITWEDMLYFTTDDGMNIIKPVSRVETLRYPLSNIKAQYHKRNVLLENIGAIGILSAQDSDMAGTIPMSPEEKQRIRNDWFRRSKDELIITEAKVDWTPMSFPTKDLMLFEELTADKIALFDAYGMNSNIFSSDKGATFTNVRDSIRMIYTDTIIPETQSLYDSMMRQWGLHQQGYYLQAEFDHLPIMQDDEVQSANTMKIKAETLEKLRNLGVEMDEQEIRHLLRIDY
jgi:hypothetical protein